MQYLLDLYVYSLLHCQLQESHRSYVARRRRARHSITGVLYLHPVGDDLGSDQLKRNIHALNFLLGESWLPRLTIAVVAKADEGPVDETMLSAFKEPTSPFYPAHVACAEIRALSLEPQNIRDILLRYTQLPPQMPDVQTNFRIGQTQRLLSYINTGMKGPSPKTIDPRTPHQQTTDSRRSSHKTTLGESKDAVQKLELALIESQAEVASLRNQLEQTRSEYASLRSELQLQDNTEQNKIVQSLNDLNRDIENFGRAVAERLVDRYLESAENASTTLQASNISELKRQLGHREGEASLVMSSTGAGMLAEDFIDLALRFTLCRLLYENIFRPFHPALARSPENKFVAGLYEKIQIQGKKVYTRPTSLYQMTFVSEHQTLSAKWRANAFLAIERGDPNLRIGLINKYFEAAIADIHLLLAAFFGEQTEIKLAEQDYNCLRDVISSAWDWNLVLRGTVIVLGDLQPTIYPTCSPFDPTTMAEFEPRKSKKVPPGIAMCTIALGLTASRLRVIGGVPRDEVVCKASVVTEHRYD